MFRILSVIALLALIAIGEEITVEFHLRFARESSLSLLRQRGFDPLLTTPSSAKVTGHISDRLVLQNLGFEILSQVEGVPFSSIAPPTGYHTPEELFEEFQGIAASYPSIAQLIDITETYKLPLTHEGRRIYALKISDNVEKDEIEPNLLVISNHHSRELITPELALNTSLHLVNYYGSDSQVTKLVDNYQIYIMWTLNPDGLAYVWSKDNMWRKNRNPEAGVDLNRNYPIGWDFSCGGSTIPASETYRGVAPSSEPETQTMIAFQKDRKFAKVLDFHSYAREVRIIYGDCASLPASVDNYFKDIATGIADTISYVQARSCCMGGNIHFAYHDQGSLTFLIETGTAFQPSSAVMKQELVRVLPGTLEFLSLPIPASGRILDRNSSLPISAKLDVVGLNFELEEVNFSHPQTGLYHIWLPDGLWDIVVSAPGYITQTFSIRTVSSGSVVDIQLTPQ